MYADFECLLVPSGNGGTKHIPCGYAAIRVATNPGHNEELECYSEPGSPEDIVDHFLEYLEKQDKFAQEILSVNQPMNLTDEEEQTFQDASHCYVCGGHFVDDNLKKVRDHDHLTSKFRGAACNSCNLALKPRTGKSRFSGESGYFIPIFLHNASNYDFKLIVKYFSNRFASKEISVIASNTEIHRISDWQSPLFGLFQIFGNESRCPHSEPSEEWRGQVPNYKERVSRLIHGLS